LNTDGDIGKACKWLGWWPIPNVLSYHNASWHPLLIPLPGGRQQGRPIRHSLVAPVHSADLGTFMVPILLENIEGIIVKVAW